MRAPPMGAEVPGQENRTPTSGPFPPSGISGTRPSRSISSRKRDPVRKALVVGCTYQGHLDYKDRIEPLLGTSNDAYAFALSLVNLWEFHPNDICLLTDALPASCYSLLGRQQSIKLDTRGIPLDPQAVPRDKARNENTKAALPTRHNILMGMNWLTGDIVDGDVLVFYYAGYGVQIDNMSGWVGEGYDEAIVPLDYRQLNGEINAISTAHLREQLTNTGNTHAQLYIFMDCCGSQSLLDPCGTNKSWPNYHIKGAKTKGIWPLTNVSDKVLRAEYNTNLMRNPKLYDRYARPRYIPAEEVSNTQELRDFSLQLVGGLDNTNISGFQFSAAEWSQLSVEACLPSIGIRGYDQSAINKSQRSSTATISQVPVIHGVFTYCLINAMQLCVHDAIKSHTQKKCTVVDLQNELTRRFQILRKTSLPALDQVPSLTVYSQGKSNPNSDLLFWPLHGENVRSRYNSYTSEKLKRSPIPYIPDERQWMNAHVAQNIIIYWESKRRSVAPYSSPTLSNAQVRTPPHPFEHPESWKPMKAHPSQRRFYLKDPDPGDGKFVSGVFAQKKSRGLCQLDN